MGEIEASDFDNHETDDETGSVYIYFEEFLKGVCPGVLASRNMQPIYICLCCGKPKNNGPCLLKIAK